MTDFLWLLLPLGLLGIEAVAFVRRRYAIQALQQAVDNIYDKTDKEKKIIAATVKPALDIVYLLVNVFTVPFVFVFVLVRKKNTNSIDNMLRHQPDRYEELVKQSIVCAFHTSFILSTIIAIEFVIIMAVYIVFKKSTDNIRLIPLLLMVPNWRKA